MAKKKQDLETLRSNLEASKKAYEEAEKERLTAFTNLLFSDEELRKNVLDMKTPELKANAKMWAEYLKKISPYNPQ